MITRGDRARLDSIRNEILGLLDEANYLLRNEGIIYDRAKSYWLAHAEIAMGTDKYADSSMSMLDTMQELEEKYEGEE